MRVNKLGRLFIAASMSLVGNHSVTAQSVVPDSPPENDPNWNRLAQYKVPYVAGSWEAAAQTTQPADALPKGRVLGVQIESAYRPYLGLTLSRYSPTQIAQAHEQAAAAILNTAADRSGFDIDVECFESLDDIERTFENIYLPATQELFSRANVVCLSMGYDLSGDQKYQSSYGYLNSIQEVEEAMEFWDERPQVIMVQSAGNNGRDPSIHIERPGASAFAYNPNYIRVGEAISSPVSGVVVRSFSSKSAPAFVTANPFHDGFSYPYILKDDDLRAQVNKTFAEPSPHDNTKTAGNLFDERIIQYGHDLTAWVNNPNFSRPINPFSHYCRRLFTYDFDGKALLQSDNPADFKAENLAKIREAYINGLVAAAKVDFDNHVHDKNGGVTKLDGTSFSAPYAAGLLLEQYQLNPELGPGTLLSAAYIAAQEIEHQEPLQKYMITGPWGRHTEAPTVPIFYYDNGSGLAINSQLTGFGYLDRDAFAAEIKTLNAMLAQDPSLSTNERHISTGYMTRFNVRTPNRDANVPKGMVEYCFDMPPGIITRSISITMVFGGAASNAPQSIKLINPKNVAVEMCPTKPDNGLVSFATTPLHFGLHSEGQWRLQIPEGGYEQDRLNILRVDMVGPVRGGLIDRRLSSMLPLCKPAEPCP